MSQMDVWGNLGCYLDEDNVITFQVGTDPGRGLVRDMDSDTLLYLGIIGILPFVG